MKLCELIPGKLYKHVAVDHSQKEDSVCYRDHNTTIWYSPDANDYREIGLFDPEEPFMFLGLQPRQKEWGFWQMANVLTSDSMGWLEFAVDFVVFEEFLCPSSKT